MVTSNSQSQANISEDCDELSYQDLKAKCQTLQLENQQFRDFFAKLDTQISLLSKREQKEEPINISDQPINQQDLVQTNPNCLKLRKLFEDES